MQNSQGLQPLAILHPPWGEKRQKPGVAAPGSSVYGLAINRLLAAPAEAAEAAAELAAEVALQAIEPVAEVAPLLVQVAVEVVHAVAEVAPLVVQVALEAAQLVEQAAPAAVAGAAVALVGTRGGGLRASRRARLRARRRGRARNLNPRRHHLAHRHALLRRDALGHAAGGLVRHTDLLAHRDFLVLGHGDAAGLADRDALGLVLGLVGADRLADRDALVGALRPADLDALALDRRLADREREVEAASAAATIALVAAAAAVAAETAAAATAAVVTAEGDAILLEGKMALLLGLGHPLDLLTAFHHGLLFHARNLDAARPVFHHRLGDVLVRGARNALLLLDRFGAVRGVALLPLHLLHDRPGLLDLGRYHLADLHGLRRTRRWGTRRPRHHRGWARDHRRGGARHRTRGHGLGCSFLLCNSRERHHCQERTRENEFAHTQHGNLSVSKVVARGRRPAVIPADARLLTPTFDVHGQYSLRGQRVKARQSGKGTELRQEARAFTHQVTASARSSCGGERDCAFGLCRPCNIPGATRCEVVRAAGLCRVREGMAVREWVGVG